jgi:EAL domain-containing protein (putative c-di-GMP-specific phosphodiesterase class I)
MKIDRSFVARLGTSARDDAVVAAIVDWRTPTTSRSWPKASRSRSARRLRAMGCDSAQGYLMGRPMRAADIEALCRAGHTW